MRVLIAEDNQLNQQLMSLYMKRLGWDFKIVGDGLQAVAPCLLLQQMGYINLKTLKGGFVATNKFKEPAESASEVMLLDTVAMKAKQEIKGSETETKKPQAVVPVRKGASAGGGC